MKMDTDTEIIDVDHDSKEPHDNSHPQDKNDLEENKDEKVEVPEQVDAIQSPQSDRSNNNEIENIILTEKEIEIIEETVLRKYTGLNMDLASENQLLKEDVIKCRCELEKYNKKMIEFEKKLEKANNCNDELRQQVDKLSAEVHQFKSDRHKVCIHVDTQTSADDFMELDDTLYDVNLPGAKTDTDMSFDWKLDTDIEPKTAVESLQTPGMSLADSLKATAEATMNQTGFVYDEQSGLYYDYSSGYYYNADKGLYYDPKSGTYYYYNDKTGKYEYHSRVDLSYYTGMTGYVDRDRPSSAHSSHRHSHIDRYSDRYERSPEYSSGKKKKKKDSKRRDSDERDSRRRSPDDRRRSSEEKEHRRRNSDDKEHKKKKRKKDKSKDKSSESDDDRKDRKKRKTSPNDETKDKKKKEDNSVIGEVNYKKMKQSEKLSHDYKPKILSEKKFEDLCDDMALTDEHATPKPESGGGKKIKLVLKKKEKEPEKEETQGKNDEKGEDKTEENSDNVTSSDNKTDENNAKNQSENKVTEPQSKTDTDNVANLKDSGISEPIDMFADDGTISYNKVGIVNSEEILRICSELNQEDTDDENDTGEQEISSNQGDNENKGVEDETKEILGVEGDSEECNEKIIKIPVKEGDIYSDEDDIMIIEKEEEKIMIELDSESDNENPSEKNMHENPTEDNQSSLEPVHNPSQDRIPGLELGELNSSSSSSDSSSSSSSSSQGPSTWVELVRQPEPASEESIMKNAPCIRAMVSFSNVLDEGMLFVVTIKGGMIGREARSDLVIPVPDINVSKVHAEIRYNSKGMFYMIQDKGSQNGTYINEARISETKKVSKWTSLSHGDTLQISCTRFDLHIHPGTDTCDKCEPGLLIQKNTQAKSNISANVDRKQQLRNLKKKYGLANSSYTDNMNAINNPSYKDKAAERRREVGSDCPVEPESRSASVHVKIQETNKGHKMLKKLGWTEGESLGKDNSGIQEPINVNMRIHQQAGLGAFGKANEISLDNVGGVQTRHRLLQTQMRAKDISEPNKSLEPKLWVQGETENLPDSNK